MRRQYLSNGKCVLVVVVVIALMFGAVAQASVNLPPMTLTIIGPSGTQVVLHETDIGSMASYRDVGGRINSVGTLSGWGTYTGVTINTFCDLVGGIHSSQTLRVTASDNYNMTFTYAQVDGDFATYNATKHRVNHTQPLTTILAYHFNDMNLTSGGPLRFAIVGPEGLYTNSTYWVQKVVKLEILGTASVGGYVDQIDTIDLSAPWISLTSIVTVATASVIASVVYLRRRKRQQN